MKNKIKNKKKKGNHRDKLLEEENAMYVEVIDELKSVMKKKNMAKIS